MEQPHSINGMEMLVCLERMGLTQHHRAGANRVLIAGNTNERLVFRFDDRWEIPRGDVEMYLNANDLSSETFWNVYQSLYQSN